MEMSYHAYHMVIHSNFETFTIGTRDDGLPFRIFLIDDSPAMTKILSRFLVGFGMEVAGECNESLRAIEQVAPLADKLDFITLDITMPGLDGLTLLPDLIKACPKSKVLMCSAMGDMMRVKKAISLGAKHFIVKPFNKEKLFDVLTRVI